VARHRVWRAVCHKRGKAQGVSTGGRVRHSIVRGEFIFGYFWLFLVIFGYFWLFLVISLVWVWAT
jgi:hypothetical protein